MSGESTLARRVSTPVNRQVEAWHPPIPWTEAVTAWIGAPFQATWPLFWPFMLIAIFTVVFRWTNADVAISDLFYDHAAQEWSWFFHTGCTLFYRGGIYPAFFLFGMAIVVLVTGLLLRSEKLYRTGLFLSLLFVIGPGLIVNYGFKNHWGRPRPHQIVDFNGTMSFVPLGTPGTLDHHNSSFPSGHAAVAFYLIGPAFLANPRRRGLGTKLMMIGLGYGGAMALVRVVQGGHFVSDVVWSAAIVYFTAVALSALILRLRAPLLPQTVFTAFLASIRGAGPGTVKVERQPESAPIPVQADVPFP